MIGFRAAIGLMLLVTLGGLLSAAQAHAEDLKVASAELSEQSFRLLDQLSTRDPDHRNPLIGPVAVFTGDVDGLHRAITDGDLPSAECRLASLQADAVNVDHALNEHLNSTAASRWNVIKQQLRELADDLLPSQRDFGHGEVGCGIDTAAGKYGPVFTDGRAVAEGPKIQITSRDSVNRFLWLKGYFEGRALKSAGLFDGSSRLKAFKVSGIPGRQRVDFDLRLDGASPVTVLRVSDANGRTAEAFVLGDGSAVSPLSPTEVPSTITPPNVDDSIGNSGDDTAEIPSRGPLLPSPSKRHTLVSKLGDAEIRILSVTRTSDFSPTYRIIGQIAGRGITRAGIYVNGRLLQSIPITSSAGNTSFERRIMVRKGSTAIRAYTAGNNFIEQPVDFSDAADTASLQSVDEPFGTSPISANRLSVQISEIRPVTADVYAVTGVISGVDIASAGLYQNGVLSQNLNLSSGLGSALGSLVSGSARSFNFKAQFNPYAGPASVRAFDSTGAYSEQPIIIAGISRYGTAWPNSPHVHSGNSPYNRGSFYGPSSRSANTRSLW